MAKPRRGHGPIARLYRGETRFDFVGKRRIWFAISTLIIVLGIVSIILRGGLNLGIEFKGGTEWTIAAPGVSQTQAVDAIKGTGLIDPTVQLLGTGSNQTLTVQSDLNKLPLANSNRSARRSDAMTRPHGGHHAQSRRTTRPRRRRRVDDQHGGCGPRRRPHDRARRPRSPKDKVSVTTVGPTWGSSITNDAIKALIIFFIVVGIYISIRFEPKMALAAFIAMVHDVAVAIGIYSIFNFQVTPDTVVAILTILGYSLYDTVVVFDRVRDNTRGIGSSGRLTYPQLINLSMNQTLARSINTSAVAILPVLAVLLIGAQFLGASTLQSYGLALFVGLLSGAYSSIFIASPVLCMMKEREAALGRHRQPAGQARGDGRVLLGGRRRQHEHPDERGRRRPDGPGRGGCACRHPVGRLQAQWPHPAGLGERTGWGRRDGRRRWWWRHGDRCDGSAVRWRLGVVGAGRERAAATQEQGQAQALTGRSRLSGGPEVFAQAGTLDGWWPWPG